MHRSTPVIDLHCDLLSYLTRPDTTVNDDAEIGCAVKSLQQGNVKLQVMAIFAPTAAGSAAYGLKQSQIFHQLPDLNSAFCFFDNLSISGFAASEMTGVVAAVENASAFCDEDMPLKLGFETLERLIEIAGPILYVGFTHHAENRFGGGNFSTAGLKKDGMALLDYLHDRKIAVDLSHTSDSLAHGILNYTVKQNLKLPIIASHSNYRAVYDHPRNLPDEFAKEIIHRGGLIGLNFVRAFVNPDRADSLSAHVEYGLALGGENAVCYGADFFYTKDHPDKNRIPFYFPEHENATVYPNLNAEFRQRFGSEVTEKIASKNALKFITKLWA